MALIANYLIQTVTLDGSNAMGSPFWQNYGWKNPAEKFTFIWW